MMVVVVVRVGDDVGDVGDGDGGGESGRWW